MKKYVYLYWAFFRASLTADLEFRMNFAVRIITDLFWYIAQLASFEILYNFTDEIGSWNRAQMRVFLGVLFVVDATYMVIFSANLDTFSDSVRKGNLDLLLAKPVKSQFIISCQRATTAHLGNLAVGMGWLVWSLLQLDSFPWLRLLWLLITVPSGVMIFYGLRFVFSAMAVIFTRAENLQYLWYHIYKLGLRPDTIYFPWLKIVILTVVPVGLIASTPSSLLVGGGAPWMAFWCLAVASVVTYLSTVFWRYSLKQYTSASS